MLNGRNRILLVEDDETLRETLAEVLKRERFEVATARDGEDGYRQALAQPPDLIVTDLHMPLLDGVEMARMIRRHNGRLGQVPILALSANLQDYHLPERMNSGIDRFFDKAVGDRQSLLTTIHAMLNAKAAASAR